MDQPETKSRQDEKEKKVYTPQKLVIHGSVEDLTRLNPVAANPDGAMESS